MTLTTAARESRLCTFIVGDLLLGLPVEEVSEVVRAEVLTPVPLAPSGVLGLLNLRGRIVTAVDARVLFGLAPRETGEPTAHVIVRVLDEQVSLVVDRTSDVVTVTSHQLEEVPETVDADIRRLLTGSYQRAGTLLLVLDSALAVSVHLP
jgi:purine-binding chemotaxis protein CheW